MANELKKFHYPYHVTARCINLEWFGIPMDELWELYSYYLFFLNRAFGIKIFSFVLMSNHFHCMLQPTENNLGDAMNYFMRETSRIMGGLAGRCNQTYGGPYRKSRIGSEKYFYHAYKYVYRNPVEAGMAERVENYPYSTLFGLLSGSLLLIPIEEDLVLFGRGVENTLKWLNASYKKDHRSQIKVALKKRDFAFGRNKKSERSELEVVLS
jgi:putative transposase